MEIINDNKEKLKLKYPCSWCYKIIGKDEKSIQEAVKKILLQKPHSLRKSNKSKNSKYISINLELLIDNEDERIFIYNALKDHQHIKMIL